jgi:mono/diheme cytochrome c family protein
MIRMLIALGLLLPGAALAADAGAGATVAAAKCAGCHGAGGAGDGVMLQTLNVTTPPVPWTSKAQMAQFTDAQLTSMIKGGGASQGKPSLMPAFGSQLSDDQVANVVAYIRSLGQ